MNDLSICGTNIMYGDKIASSNLPENIKALGVMPTRWWLVGPKGQLYSTKHGGPGHHHPSWLEVEEEGESRRYSPGANIATLDSPPQG